MYRLFSAARSAGTYAHGVLCLLVMLALIRACIPAGFMPDPAALAQGRWALMLCPSASGDLLRSIAVLARETVDDTTHGSGAAHVEGISHPEHANRATHVGHANQTGHTEHTGDANQTALHVGPGDADHAGHAAHAGYADIVVPGEQHDHFTHTAGLAVDAHADHDARPAGLDCPYSLVTNLTAALPPPMLAVALLPRAQPQFVVGVPQSRPPLPPAGPPLGSRAPPYLQA